MQIVLLERVAKLGQIGDVKEVKDGYARNYLIPRKKALRATKENLLAFEKKRQEIEKSDSARKATAESVQNSMSDVKLIIIRQASESGQLFGSVRSQDICELLQKQGFDIQRSHIVIDKPIKKLGVHDITIHLHSDVSFKIGVVVAQTEEEAQRALNTDEEEDTQSESL